MDKNIKPHQSNSIEIRPDTPLPFEVGLNLNVEINREGTDPVRIDSSIMGWIRPEYLMVLISYDTRTMTVPVHTDLITRYIYRGQIYGFETRLVHKATDPVPAWFLSFPQRIEVINLRRSSRVPMFLQALDSNGKTYFTHDISRDGLSLIAEKATPGSPQEVGQQIELSFSLPNGVPVESIRAEIKRKYSDFNQEVLGVAFNAQDQKEREKIARYLADLEKIYKGSKYINGS